MSAATPRLSETPLVHPRGQRRGGHARRRALYGRRRARFPSGVGERMDALAWWVRTHGAPRASLADSRALSAEAFLKKYGA